MREAHGGKPSSIYSFLLRMTLNEQRGMKQGKSIRKTELVKGMGLACEHTRGLFGTLSFAIEI
jgi:hypothetical protein